MRALRYFVLIGSVIALCAAMPAAADNSVTYQDSVGEGGPDATVPDITTTVVSNNDAAMLTFQISIPNKPQLTRDMALDLEVDTDNNPATGDQFGIDYVIEIILGEVHLYKWDGTNFTRRVGDPPATSLIYAWVNGVVKIQISAAELGNTKKFGFDIIAVSGLVIDDVTGDIDATNAKADIAPAAGAGLYSYEVKVAPAKLVAKTLTQSPSPPQAGKNFTVRMTAVRSDTNATIVNGEVDCAAKVGGKTLRPKSEKFVGKQAVCVFKIPADASGKTIRGTIRIVFEGKKLTRPFAGKIR
jgi:hypothetical protein